MEIDGDQESTDLNFKFKVIPTNSEKLKGFAWGPFNFKDSLLFLKSSLDENVGLIRQAAKVWSELMLL